MKLEDKSKVIEVLLCAARYVDEDGINTTTHQTAEDIGEARYGRASAHASDLWMRCDVHWTVSAIDHGTVCLEAAYRLIESSPTLRAEWFGRSAR